MIRFVLRWLVVLVSLSALTLFAATAARVVARPGTADPVETAVLDRATRVVRNEAMYAESTTPAEPALMPGLPLAVSAIAGRLPPQVGQARAVTLFATLLVAILVALIVQLECGSWTLGLAAGSFALLAQDLLAAAPGLASPTPPMLALVLLGFLTIRYLPGAGGALLGAIPLAGAVFVDASALWFVGAACGALALERNHRFATFTITAGVLFAAGYVVLSRAFGPWFNFAAWDVPLATVRFSAAVPLRWIGEFLLRTLGVWVTAGVLSFALSTEPWAGRRGLWMWMGIAGLVASFAATQTRHFGGDSLLASIVVVSLLGPSMLQRVARHLAAWQNPDEPGGENVVLTAVLLQFAAVLAAVPVAHWLPDVTALWRGLG